MITKECMPFLSENKFMSKVISVGWVGETTVFNAKKKNDI